MASSLTRFDQTDTQAGDWEKKNEICKLTFFLRVNLGEDREFAKQLVYCILYCTTEHRFPLFIFLRFCVYCFANSVSYIQKPAKGYKNAFLKSLPFISLICDWSFVRLKLL